MCWQRQLGMRPGAFNEASHSEAENPGTGNLQEAGSCH